MVALESLINFVSFVLSPPRCVHCKKKLIKRSHFCSDCFSKISPVVSYDLALTPTKKIKVHALSGYNELLRSLILAKRNKKVEGCRILADLIWEKTNFFTLQCDGLVPVPLHWTRRMQRGFNQAEEMANYLAKKKNTKSVKLVTRVVQTTYQADVPIKLRADNVKNAFILHDSQDLSFGKESIL